MSFITVQNPAYVVSLYNEDQSFRGHEKIRCENVFFTTF